MTARGTGRAAAHCCYGYRHSRAWVAPRVGAGHGKLSQHKSNPAFSFARSRRDRPFFGDGATITSFEHLKGNGLKSCTIVHK